jgi:DNA-binding LytR/AlgR family response regulator
MEQKISCIVIDDETPALSLMDQYIRQTGELQLLEKFKSPVKALEFIQQHPADIVFCDIQMPELSGINFVKALSASPVIIFTTAYSEFAADAYEVDAIDYLQKPFSYERFVKAVGKAKEQLKLKELHKDDFSKIENAQKEYIMVKAGHKLIKVLFEDILYVEAYQEYVKIITRNERIITLERMKNMETLLPSNQFIRVHRSYIIAKNKVRSLAGNLLEIDGQQIPISRELKEKVLAQLF